MKASRPYKITIEGKTTITDDYGQEVPTWAAFAEEFADVRFSKGSERRQAAQEGASAAATFVVLSNGKTRAVSVSGHRITFDGAQWDIVSNIPSREFNASREIEATRVLA